MARLALVSRNPVMSMGLSATEHEIEEVRPSAFVAWLESGNDALVDALVLDLGSASTALNVVGDMRATGRWTPVLLVAGTDGGWDSPELRALPGVDLLTLPIDSHRLQSATKAVLRYPTAPPNRAITRTAPRDPTPLIDDLEVEAIPISEPNFLASDEPEDAPVTPPQPARARIQVAEPPPETDSLLPLVDSPPEIEKARTDVQIPIRDVDVEATSPATSHREKSPAAKSRDARPEESVPTTGPATPSPKVTRKRAKRPRDRMPAPMSAKTNASSDERSSDRFGDRESTELIDTLLDSADRLYTLAETAGVVVEDAVHRANANSGALLVPDDDVWRVAAGLGLRPLEYRYQLTVDSWLVERVSESGKGILIENSDVARQHMRGAPLASRTHLLAVPVPIVKAILLLSRDKAPPFDETVLHELAGLAQEAEPLIQRAMNVRLLARELSRHIDPSEIPRD